MAGSASLSRRKPGQNDERALGAMQVTRPDKPENKNGSLGRSAEPVLDENRHKSRRARDIITEDDFPERNIDKKRKSTITSVAPWAQTDTKVGSFDSQCVMSAASRSKAVREERQQY